jgi:hypothetical protein
MCALLIEVLFSPLVSSFHFSLLYFPNTHLFQLTSTSVSAYLDTSRVETRGVVSVFINFLIDLDYFRFLLSFVYTIYDIAKIQLYKS